MDSMGDALEGSAGAVPDVAALVQLLSEHATLALTVVLVALLLIVVLAEIYNPERRAAATDQRAGARGNTGRGSGR